MIQNRPRALRAIAGVLAAVPLAILAACAAPQSGAEDADGAQPQAQAQAESEPESPPMVGGDRDAHGCIGSAGYQWCESRNECVRPWELAASEGFEDSAEAFDSHCSAASAQEAPAVDSDDGATGGG